MLAWSLKPRRFLRKHVQFLPFRLNLWGYPIRISPNYRVVSFEELYQLWKRKPRESSQEAKERQEEARRILEGRIAQRGRSLNGTWIVMTLLGAAEATLLNTIVEKGLFQMRRPEMGPPAFALLLAVACLIIGVLPAHNELFPNYIEPEGVDALKKAEQKGFGWYFELHNRSTQQRYHLWRCRFWLFASILESLLALQLMGDAIAVFIGDLVPLV